VPSDCALRVAGQIHSWREGSCVTFDDTFEHEAWNRSPFTRVVLILDSWNPDLTEAERAAVTDLVEAIGDFTRRASWPPTRPDRRRIGSSENGASRRRFPVSAGCDAAQ